MATLTAGRSMTGVIADYLSLAKPRVVLLHLVTAAAAMVLAAGGMPRVSTLLFTLAGGGLVAGAANTLNCYLDRDLDGLMSRTRRRPLPSHRLASGQALSFSMALGLTGLFILSSMVSMAAAFLCLGALAGYVLVYTLWLKRRTFWATVLGSGVGAFPPLVGWVAITGRLDAVPLVLFAIIWLWTPPHFWSLAILRRGEYEGAGLAVMPAKNTPAWLLVYGAGLVVASILLAAVARLGSLYTGVAVLLGVVFLGFSLRLLMRADSSAARGLFVYSIAYVVLLFGAMVADTALHF